MKHVGTQTIETPRLILRRFALDDAQAMYDNWASDPEVTKFLTWPTHRSPEITAELMKYWTDGYARADQYQWAITLKENGGAPIGSIAVVSHDDRIEKAEIGYCIGRAWWHQGIMTEALGAVVDFLFDEVGVRRVECRHDANNPNSGAVMKKCGLRYEGTLRGAGWNNQGACDDCYYGLLASDRESER
ncbi:MAG: GNAT family N-acetyltransferase [Clostridia bacterium]|nr:GNAT family N-acetyltransferase [Clostridia bacterium]